MRPAPGKDPLRSVGIPALIPVIAACLTFAQACPAADRTRELMETLAKQAAAIAPLAQASDIARRSEGPPDAAPLLDQADQVVGFERAFTLSDAVEAWHRWSKAHADPWFVFVGLASPEEHERAVASAGAVIALASSAIAAIDGAVESADRAGPRDDAVEADEAVARALHDRQVVLPLRAARAGAVLSYCSADTPEFSHRLAAAAAELALRVEDVSAWSSAERLLVAGWALLDAGKAVAAGEAFEKARAAADAPDAAPAVRDAALVESALGEALALSRARGPIFARESLALRYDQPPFIRAGERDVRACLAAIGVLIGLAPREAEKAFTEGARRAALAFPWILAGELASGRTVAERAHIYDRLGRRVPAGSIDSLPDVGRVALAWRLLAEDQPLDVADLLSATIDTSRPPVGPIEQDAWRLFCRAASASAEASTLARVHAVAVGFARCCGEDERAAEMLSLAARSAEARRRLASTVEERASAERDLLESLELLSHGAMAMTPADRDRWRLALGEWRLVLTARGPARESEGHAKASADTLRHVASPILIDEARVLLLRTWAAWLRVAEDEAAGAVIESIARRLLAMPGPRDSAPGRTDARNDPLDEWARACWAFAFAALNRPAEALNELSPLLAAMDEALTDSRRAAVEAGLRAHLALERLDEARALCDQLDSGEAGRSEAVTARLSALAWRAVLPATEGFVADAPPSDPSPPIAVFRLAGERAGDPASRGLHLSRLGWSLLLGGHADESVEAFRASVESQGRAIGAMRGLGEALIKSGRDAEAFAFFREIAQALEHRQDYSPDYWHAWTRLLEVLARRPRSADGDASIRREIARLRALASAEDHPACLDRLTEVERALAND